MRRITTTAGALALTCYAIGGAYAADLGGNCCADFEERVAELEATTARKGKRRVSVEVSGQINVAFIRPSGFDALGIN